MLLDQSVCFGMADIHDRHRDMRVDVDNMSYEELLALEERIGNVSTGLSEETISSQLKMKKHSIIQGAEPCCVCQEEYNDGEDVGVLECGHEFHTKCIKEWLLHKNVYPICKEPALPTRMPNFGLWLMYFGRLWVMPCLTLLAILHFEVIPWHISHADERQKKISFI